MNHTPTPMSQAVQALYDIGASVATPAQMMQVATQFDVEVWQLESSYLDYVDAASQS